MSASADCLAKARRLRDLAVSGRTNETPVMAWAAVVRECVKAISAKRHEIDAAFPGQNAYTRAELNWFNAAAALRNDAMAQVEHHRR